MICICVWHDHFKNKITGVIKILYPAQYFSLKIITISLLYCILTLLYLFESCVKYFGFSETNYNVSPLLCDIYLRHNRFKTSLLDYHGTYSAPIFHFLKYKYKFSLLLLSIYLWCNHLKRVNRGYIMVT